ncbi:FAD-binding oxidoreductase [Balneolaceae bacterium YR4-1]|uniref:FAD-binding oxidoreductase n=1 Tax=Halalkalibaculum roseum TaxID=2709311 RepID=A0A6M1SY49_9BACT|nr:FAD-binding oxidoreductase [Halalkalibaculum roseum]NGP75477.1 FAD-binding oxidoreductase [Halalkalibaculum roseum]
MPEIAALSDLRKNIRGDIIGRNDQGYDKARRVYNGMIDKKPEAIVYCENTTDVINVVRFAHEHELLTAVRGGGHNAGGLGVCDDGLVIDLSRINFTHIDPVKKTLTVGGGATWGDVDRATHAYGLAVPNGIFSTTGVGGLTLGGGLGNLTRTYGLTIDNLLEVNIVLADTSTVTANKDRNPDLFWAIRGGGGNFGIATSFKFRLHEVSTVYAGPMLWEMEEADEVMQWYREFITSADYSINGYFAFLIVPSVAPFPDHLQGKNMCGIVWCYAGDLDKAERVFRPIRKVGNVALDLVGPMPLPDLQSMFDDLYPPGLDWYWKAGYLKEWSDESISKNIKYGSTIPTPLSGMHLYPVNGAAHGVDKDETAWSHRDAHWVENIVGVDANPSNRKKIITWAQKYWEEAVHPYSTGGAYINFLMRDEGNKRIKAAYRENYNRLVNIKTKYDPNNFFSVNQNIKPKE